MMSTISGVGGTSNAWSSAAISQQHSMRDRMFAKLDSDGSGGVDQSELQTMLDKISGGSGTSAGNAADLLSRMDSDGSGSLSQGELESGMKDLMPPPTSTMAFAQRRGGEGSNDLFSKVDSDGSGGISQSELNSLLDRIAADSGASSAATGSSADSGSVAAKADAAVFKALDSDQDGSISATEFKAATAGHAAQGPRSAGGPPPGGMPPPPPGDAAGSIGTQASGSTSSSSATDPLDTNQDGVVSARERAAAALKDLMKAMDSDGDGNVSKSEIGSFISQLQSAGAGEASAQDGDSASASSGQGETAASSGRGRFHLSALREQVRSAYAEAAADTQGSTLSVVA